MKRTKVIFPKKAIEQQMLDFVIKEQTTRLIAYAEQQMEKIGERIAWNDHGNLLDSLCWAVYYNGNMRRCGYYRKSEAIEDTYLHALSKSIRQPINGHAEAQTFLAQYVPTEQSGWEVIWAVAAPYWGYWEKGHQNVMLKSFVKFSVMAHRYDVIRKQLKPAKVRFHTYVPKYAKSKMI